MNAANDGNRERKIEAITQTAKREIQVALSKP
jgi:hypothetical protein